MVHKTMKVVSAPSVVKYSCTGGQEPLCSKCTTKKKIDHAFGLLDYHLYKLVEEMKEISESTLIRAKRMVFFNFCML